MARLIDWYLVELSLRLNRALPPERVNEIVQEADAHLQESVKSRLQQGGEEVAAVEAAITAYGKPDRVAKGFLRGSRLTMLGVNPMWWTIFGSSLALAAWQFHWATLGGYFDNFGDTWQNDVALLLVALGVAIVLGAARRTLRSRRWAVVTTLALGTPALLLALAYWMIPAPRYEVYQVGISRFHIDRDVPIVRRTLSRLDQIEAYLQHGIGAFAKAGSSLGLPDTYSETRLAAQLQGDVELPPAPPHLGVTSTSVRGRPANALPRAFTSGTDIIRFFAGVSRDDTIYPAPREYGAFVEIGGNVYVFDRVIGFDEAKKAWCSFGPSDLAQVRSQRYNLAALLRRVDQARHGRLFFANPWISTQIVGAAILLLPLLLLADWIGALTARPLRRWPGRALA